MYVCVFAITVDDRGMMNRAAAAMVTLEMRSDELARFLVATIGTSSHSTDAIARSFELRDPAVLLVWLPSVLVPPFVFACRPSVSLHGLHHAILLAKQPMQSEEILDTNDSAS